MGVTVCIVRSPDHCFYECGNFSIVPPVVVGSLMDIGYENGLAGIEPWSSLGACNFTMPIDRISATAEQIRGQVEISLSAFD